jgi:hypothetical protein
MLIRRVTLPGLIASGVLVLCAPLAVQAATVKAPPHAKAPSVAAITDPKAVTRAYEAQFDTQQKFPPSKLVMVNGYALQGWTNGASTGAAIMQYATGRGWVFVESGDGEWDVPSMVQIGVPQDIAQPLHDKMYDDADSTPAPTSAPPPAADPAPKP